MPPSSGALRTYSKKGSFKRKQSPETAGPGTKHSTPTPSPSKRRRVSEEPQDSSTSPTKAEQDTDTDVDDDTPVKPKATATYGSKSKAQGQESSSQRTPSKPFVRDFSGVFDSISPSITPVGTPSKLAKRMLGRSKTDSSVEASPTAKDTTMDRTSSLPNLPSSPSREIPLPSLTSRLSGPAGTSTSSKSSTTRTYAGKYRSFLMAMPANASSGGVSLALEEDHDEQRESYNALRSRWGVDNSEDDPNPFDLASPTKSTSTTSDASPSRKGKAKSNASSRPPPVPVSSMNYLKSISELRNKGEGRRFLDEVGYLFEGLDRKGSFSLRRSTMLEIINKLCDPDFTRKAIATDFFPRTWDLLHQAGVRDEEDKLLDLLAICFLAMLARNSSSLAELAQRSPHLSFPSSSSIPENDTVLSVIIRYLDSVEPDTDLLLFGGDPSKHDSILKRAGLTKKDRTLLVSIHKVMSGKSLLFPESTTLSTPLLSAYILHTLPQDLLSAQHVETVIGSLRHSLSPNSSSTLSSSLSSHWPTITTTLPFESIYYHIMLIDAFLSRQRGMLSSSESSQDSLDAEFESAMANARDTWMADDLICLGICLEHIHHDFDDEDGEFRPERCLLSVLRTLVSLTHGDERWCQKVLGCNFTLGFLLRCMHRAGSELHSFQGSSPEDDIKKEEGATEVGEGHQQSDTDSLDVLCLVLGLLTNMVQSVEEAKDSMRTVRLNPSCTLKKGSCLTRCSCSPSSSGIEVMASLYTRLSSDISHHKTLDTEAEAESSFIRGHLAVLFGLLMTDNLANQTAILDALPSISPNGIVPKSSSSSSSKRKPAVSSQDNRIKLSRLVDQARDFVVFYTVISRKFGGSEEVDQEKESRVAKEVVTFLESLRDTCTT